MTVCVAHLLGQYNFRFYARHFYSKLQKEHNGNGRVWDGGNSPQATAARIRHATRQMKQIFWLAYLHSIRGVIVFSLAQQCKQREVSHLLNSQIPCTIYLCTALTISCCIPHFTSPALLQFPLASDPMRRGVIVIVAIICPNYRTIFIICIATVGRQRDWREAHCYVRANREGSQTVAATLRMRDMQSSVLATCKTCCIIY